MSRSAARVSLLVLAGLAALAANCAGAPPEGAAPAAAAPERLETRVVQAVEVAETSEATGTIEPWVRVTPGTKLLGRVQRVAVREGDHVRRGQLLAELERADLQAGATQARAAVRMAEVQLEHARRQHERIVALHGRGSVTQKSLEDATAAFELAQAGLEQARANLAAAEVLLGYARIEAPVAGWIARTHVEEGDMATPGAPLFELQDLTRIKVELLVPETEAVGLAAGAPVELRVEVLQRSWAARVDRVLPAADAASRTFTVQLVLDNPDGQLRSGMFARARFPRGERRALVVPASAVVERGALSGVFVVGDEGLARLRWLRLGAAAAGGVEVLSGLDDGERIVVTPPPTLVDGARVAEG